MTESGCSPPTIGVVVVAFNSSRALPDCLRAIASPEVALVVVDNHSADDSTLIARSLGAATLELPANAGFSVACNIGASYFADEVEWLAFVNPDVVIASSALIQVAGEAPPFAVAVSPLLVDGSGDPQPDLARPSPSWAGTAARYLLSSRAEIAATRARSKLTNSTERHVAVEVTSGGCLLVRRSAFVAAGGFSEAYFLNMEDVELCERLRGLGTIAINTGVTAVHIKGTSTSTLAEARRLECARAEVTFFERNRPPWQTATVAVAVVAGCVARRALTTLRRPQADPVGARAYARLARDAARSVARATRRNPAPDVAHAHFVPS